MNSTSFNKPITHKRVWIALALVIVCIVLLLINSVEYEDKNYNMMSFGSFVDQTEITIFTIISIALYLVTGLLFVLDHPKLSLISNWLAFGCAFIPADSLSSYASHYGDLNFNKSIISIIAIATIILTVMAFIIKKFNKKEKKTAEK